MLHPPRTGPPDSGRAGFLVSGPTAPEGPQGASGHMEDRAVPNVARSRASAPSRGNAHLEMIEFNGTTYSLCLLDTNVVSEIVKRPREVGLRFLERFGYGPREGFPLFPVVSPYTVAEVLQRGDVTEKDINKAIKAIGEAVSAVEAFPLSAPTIFAVGDALKVREAMPLAATGS